MSGQGLSNLKAGAINFKNQPFSQAQRESITTSEEKILEVLLPSLDIEICLKNNKFWKIFARVKGTSIYNQIRERIKTGLKCQKCDKRGEIMSCGHRLCNGCSNICSCGQSPTLEDRLKVQRIICYKCMKEKDVADYHPNTCMHLCSLCIALDLENAIEKCRICYEKYNDSVAPNPIEGICMKHRNPVNVKNTYKLECNHSFCQECYKKLKKKKSCLQCNKTLLESDLYAISNPNHVICQECGNIVENNNLARKECCENNCCKECFTQNNGCKNCRR